MIIIKMNLRKKIFLLLDKNHSISSAVDEIKKINEDDSYATTFQEECIKNLLLHAKSTVPYYMNMKGTELEDFPVVNKVMMKEDINKFLSNADLKIGKIRHTSGSTGIPFEIVQDIRKAKRIQAEVLYYREITGDELGNKFINLLSPARLSKSSKLNNYKQNVISFNVKRMDSKTMEQLHDLLKRDKSITYMMGYASALEKIANYFEEKNYKEQYSVKAIVSSSEILTDKTMNQLKSIFKCPVFDRYSNEDNGFIAQTDGESRDFIVNRASYYLEILKFDKDEKAEEGEVGRIVVTDLFNYAQPFIRYDTGDLGSCAIKNINGSERTVITKLAGRISDVVYDTKNRPISTIGVGEELMYFSKIEQYQLIQHSINEFTLNIIDKNRNYKDSQYVEALQNLFGKDINVTIEYKDEIPTYDSGKFRRIICNYKAEGENVR